MRHPIGLAIACLMIAPYSCIPARAEFLPTQLSGLAIWQDAGALNLSEGARVQSWLSSGGLAYGASQASASFQPTFHTNVINGRPVVRFAGDAMDQSLHVLVDPGTQATYGSLDIGPNGITYIAVLSATRPDDPEFGGPVLGDDNNIAMFRVGSARAALGRHLFGGRVISSGDFTSFTRIAGTFSNIDAGQSNETTLYVDGIGLPSTTQINSSDTVSGLTLNIGADVTDNTTRPHFAGDLAELIVYNRQLSLSELEQVDDYLYAKYFVAAVPEPASIWMFAAGAAASVALASRRGRPRAC